MKLSLSLEFEPPDFAALAALASGQSGTPRPSPLELVERLRAAAVDLPVEDVAPALIALREWFSELSAPVAATAPAELDTETAPEGAEGD